MTTTAALTEELVELETAALRRWCAGDPSGYLEISAPEVTYFEPFLPRRLDGLAALTAHYEALRGKIHVAGFEVIAPKVTVIGDTAAVLTFDFESWTTAGGGRLSWHCSEVYARTADGWRIVQSHWSLPRPSSPAA